MTYILQMLDTTRRSAKVVQLGRLSLQRWLGTQVDVSVAGEEDSRKRINKLLYRSKQRGLLEMDILLGKWAEVEVPRMDRQTLTAFEEFLEEETPLMYKWITGQEPYPERLTRNKAFMNFYNHVQQEIVNHTSSKARNKGSAEWIKGWYDKGNQ